MEGFLKTSIFYSQDPVQLRLILDLGPKNTFKIFSLFQDLVKAAHLKIYPNLKINFPWNIHPRHIPKNISFTKQPIEIKNFALIDFAINVKASNLSPRPVINSKFNIGQLANLLNNICKILNPEKFYKSLKFKINPLQKPSGFGFYNVLSVTEPHGYVE